MDIDGVVFWSRWPGWRKRSTRSPRLMRECPAVPKHLAISSALFGRGRVLQARRNETGGDVEAGGGTGRQRSCLACEADNTRGQYPEASDKPPDHAETMK